jgi:hypothetical protein
MTPLQRQVMATEESEATISYLEERKKAEAIKDKLSIAVMKSTLNVNALKENLLLKLHQGK